MFDITDVLAMLFLVFAGMRRSDATSAELQGDVPPERRKGFETWQAMAAGAYNVTIRACLLKLALDKGWLWVFRDRVSPSVLWTGGRLIGLAWLVALLVSAALVWRAHRFRERLGLS